MFRLNYYFRTVIFNCFTGLIIVFRHRVLDRFGNINCPIASLIVNVYDNIQPLNKRWWLSRNIFYNSKGVLFRREDCFRTTGRCTIIFLREHFLRDIKIHFYHTKLLYVYEIPQSLNQCLGLRISYA